MPSKAQIFQQDSDLEGLSDFWKVWIPEIKTIDKNKVLVANRELEPRWSYALSDDWTQKKIFNQFMQISNEEDALTFSEDWGFLLDAEQMRVANLIDTSKSIKWLHEQARLSNRTVLASELAWPTLSSKRHRPPYLVIELTARGGRIISTYSRPFELDDVETVWWNKQTHTNSKLEVSAILSDPNLQESKIETYEIVALYLNMMLQEITPHVVIEQNSLTLRNFSTPWSAIVHQLIEIAVGGKKLDKCRRPGCTNPVERKRVTRKTCSDACQKWCYRNLEGEGK